MENLEYVIGLLLFDFVFQNWLKFDKSLLILENIKNLKKKWMEGVYKCITFSWKICINIYGPT